MVLLGFLKISWKTAALLKTKSLIYYWLGLLEYRTSPTAQLLRNIDGTGRIELKCRTKELSLCRNF